MNQQSIQNIIDRLCSMAIKEAQPHILDYSHKSVAVLDCVLEYHSKRLSSQRKHAQDNLSTLEQETELWQLTSMYGAYIGQCLMLHALRAHGFTWQLSDGDLLILQSQKRSFSPLARIYKQLLEHSTTLRYTENTKNTESTSSIESYYNGVLLVVRDSQT